MCFYTFLIFLIFVLGSTDSIETEYSVENDEQIEPISEEGYCTGDENKEEGTFPHKIEDLSNSYTHVLETDGIDVNNNKNNKDNDNKNSNTNSNNESPPMIRKISKSRSFNRLKSRRKKMEELKDIYKYYAPTRGLNDFYNTMLESYEDFALEYEEFENIHITKFNNNDKKRSFSGTETEALMKRDLVLTELADTEKSYVEALGFIVNVSCSILTIR